MNDSKEASFNLGVTRFVYFALVFYLVGVERYFLDWQNVPTEFWLPTGPLLAFDRPPLSIEVHTWLFYFWRWSLPACALGVGYRVLAPLNFIAGFILMNYAHSFGYQTHTYMPVLLVGLTLSFSAASDVLSLDSILFRKWLKPSNDVRLYALPLRIAQLTFCLVFFSAGISKLRAGGVEWFTTDTLRNYFLLSSILYEDINAVAHQFRLNHALYSIPWLCHVLAFLTITLELSAPLAFFKRRAAWIIVPALFFAQVFIFFTIFVNFRIYLAAYAAWVNWRWLVDLFRDFVRGALRRRANA
ncbi:hypothetical protein BH10BDE1_BH10BDE1_04540 [soil metagenome]